MFSAPARGDGVALALWAVEDHLVTSVCVNGGHDTGLISSEVVETLCHRTRQLVVQEAAE